MWIRLCSDGCKGSRHRGAGVVAKITDDVEELLAFYDYPCEVISKPRDRGSDETGRHVGQRELPGQVRLLDGVGCMGGLRHAGWAGR
jgi:hypothetical protein